MPVFKPKENPLKKLLSEFLDELLEKFLTTTVDSPQLDIQGTIDL